MAEVDRINTYDPEDDENFHLPDHDPANFVHQFEPDVKVKIAGIPCYDETWEYPKCCWCFPYEAGIRAIIVFLVFQIGYTIFRIASKWDCMLDNMKFNADY